MLSGIDYSGLIAKVGERIELTAFDPAFTSDFKNKAQGFAQRQRGK